MEQSHNPQEQILVVDDEESVRRLLQQTLSRFGYTVTTASDGEEALALCRTHSYALVLTDLKMPRLGGKELLLQIKDHTPETEVIMMTAYPTIDDAVHTLQTGAYDFILKPFNLMVLEKTVHRCLERRQLRKDLDGERRLRRKLMELDRLKSEFLSNVSHELRTPLHIMLGHIDLLRTASKAGALTETHNAAGHIEGHARHLLSLISDLLELVSLENGKKDLVYVAVDIGALLTDISESIASRAREKSLQVNIEHDGNLVTMRTDPLCLERILRHLCDNAVKFTASGEICIATRPVQQHGQYMAEFIVSDTGIGIAPEQYVKIFETFQQVDGSSTRQYGGLGIGLALCRKLVDVLGGSINVESEIGKGSTFHILLPMNGEEPRQPVSFPPVPKQ
jgi:signal transduction histidine kinase